MLETKQLMEAIYFHSIESQWLPSTVGFFFCVHENNETRAGLEQLEGVNDDRV